MTEQMKHPRAKIEMVTDPVAMTITVGSSVFDKPDVIRRPEVDFHFKNEICPTPIGIGPGPKSLHKFFAEMLGPRFNFRFFAANYWLWVGNRMTTRTGNMLRFEGRHWQKYDSSLVALANASLPYINEAERDNLYHLIPAILLFGLSPQEIRGKIGRGAWRRVATNSLSRNLLIMRAARRYRSEGTQEAFIRLLDIPSGVLPAITRGVDEDEAIAARITPRKRVVQFDHTLMLVRDTRRMMMPDEFNPQWGLARMQREHELATKAIMQRRYSTKAFAPAWQLAEDGFSAELLTSQADIATEGATQHHCVASYARTAAVGKYAVFRIDGKERATAGVVGHVVDQVYGACNAQVSDECRAFASKVAARYAATSARAAA
jgi:hypothetical protein